MNELATSAVTVLLAIVGVAVVAVLVSKNAATSQVIQSTGQSFSMGLGTALGPVSGGFGGLSPLTFSGGVTM